MGTQRGRLTVYSEIVAEALTKENCKYWFECVKNYLVAGDVWDVVDGSFSKPPNEDDEDHKEGFMTWRKKNAAAMHAILVSCGTQAFSHISKVSEAKVTWNILNLAYNYNSPLDQSELELESVSEAPLPDGCIASPVDPSSFKSSTSKNINDVKFES
ncbi:uncharacterized protein G2W53_026142 [Senna tora]|uniref:DUF4219 domain-containing protein n=1 Tax=Senna tora TaxID=362788 RepID=A0A834WFE7_9FABA|nr:uncharacterized protein G2W53_026142 [Senna tora]